VGSGKSVLRVITENQKASPPPPAQDLVGRVWLCLFVQTDSDLSNLVTLIGYWCGRGSSSSTQYVCGGAYLICPEGFVSPKEVRSGYYSYPPSIQSNLRFEERICEPGYWCLDGVRHQCPPREIWVFIIQIFFLISNYDD